jgi:serine/threonine protein kinase
VSAFDPGTGRLPPYSMLQKRYLILGLAGEGGMGAVYKAFDKALKPERYVAIKEMSQPQSKTPGELRKAVRRFQREALILRSLDHPGLPHVYDSFSENGRYYLVMDFIEGKTLFGLLEASLRQTGHALALEQVLGYACQLCDVLDYLHRQDPPVVFRDLKPSNVMVTKEGRIYVIDFGIARYFRAGQRQDTENFASVGYAAPEIYQGIQTNPRSDLYSLGATLHCCLTGVDPKLNKPTFFDFQPLRSYAPQVPKELESLIYCLLEKEEALRPASAYAVRQELNAIIQMLAQRGIVVSGPLILKGSGSRVAPEDETRPQGMPTLPVPRGSPGAGFLKSVVALCSTLLFPNLLRLIEGSLLFAGSLFTTRRWLISWNRLRSLSLKDVKSGIIATYENIEIGIRGLSSPVLTPHFVFLLLLRLVLLIVVSNILVQDFQGSFAFAAFCLALFSLCVVLYAGTSPNVRDRSARSIFLCTGPPILAACFALQAFPSAQQVLHTFTVNQLLSFALIVVAVFSLIRANNRLAWLDSIAATIITWTIAILQYGLGVQELRYLISAVSVPGTTINTYVQINAVFTGLLVLIGCLLLFRVRRSFSGLDRFMLLLVTICFTLLQYTFGYAELSHNALLVSLFHVHTAGSKASSLQVAYAYILLCAMPLIVAGIALFTGRRFAFIDRFSLFVLAVACVLLQNAKGTAVSISLASLQVHPLAYRVEDLLTINQVFIYGLAAAGLLLLVRVARDITWIDRAAVFVVAFACTLLQSTFWSGVVQQAELSLPGVDGPSPMPAQLSIIAVNQLVADGLLLVVVSGLMLSVLILLIRSLRQLPSIDRRVAAMAQDFNWVEGFARLIDRLIVFGILLTATLLVLFFGKTERLLQQSFKIGSQGTAVVTVGEICVAVLGVLACISFLRTCIPKKANGSPYSPARAGSSTMRLLNRWDRLTVFIAVVVCMVLVFQNRIVQQISSPISRGLQEGSGRLLQVMPPALLLFLGLVAVGLLSFLWLKRAVSSIRVDRLLRFVLIIFFGGTIACALLHFLWLSVLPFAFIMLMGGIFVAIQMERVR